MSSSAFKRKANGELELIKTAVTTTLQPLQLNSEAVLVEVWEMAVKVQKIFAAVEEMQKAHKDLSNTITSMQQTTNTQIALIAANNGSPSKGKVSEALWVSNNAL